MVSPDLLKNLRIFNEVPETALNQLATAMELKTFKPTEVICREGDMGRGLYLIAAGSVVVEKKLFRGDDSTKTIAHLGVEEFFGEMAFLQNQPHSATVSAKEDTTVLFLSRASLDELIRKDPKIALDQVMAIMTGLSDRLRSTTRELVTVFEVARVVGLSLSVDDLARRVVAQLSLNLSSTVTIGFYRWNPFNDEYSLITASGQETSFFPAAFEPSLAIKGGKGSFVRFDIEMSGRREGLLMCYLALEKSLSSGEKQMMDTVAAVLAPALSTARYHEEDAARLKLQQMKQQGTYL